MSSYTTNLNLLKKDPESDGSDYFNIQTMLNDNWDKIDTGVAAKETPAGAQAKVDNLAGAGRTTQTVKGNADAITALNQTVTSHSAETATTAAKGHIQLATTVEATAGTDTTKAITAAGLKAALAALVAAAPSTLDTLDELANALGDDPNFATTITNLIGGKIDKSLATAANDFLVASGNGAWTKKTLAEVRTLLACLLTTGGTISGELNMADQLLTRPHIKDYAEAIGVTPATTGTVTLDLTTGNTFNLTPTGPCTIAIANPPASGRVGSFTLQINMPATLYAITFPASFKFDGGETPTFTASKTAVITGYTLDGGTTYRVGAWGTEF